ncbi:ankyrin repeat domain-containing protein [cf. Phormidesmis sp. LEGE 11477]|uniref:ankyrin repeat domain-containing protein n=1 Tax=cf. Phormidesmis sp. LEGE 11477 TaxID=1828680 RepID=UPI001D15607F|nr:ankyrin repeat domain-containing protein [cf. Phormidesmis sp. LEGE 11477]
MTKLMDAIMSNNVASVQKLIEKGADVNQLDAQNPPLIMAAYHGYTEIVTLLLQAGADTRAVDPNMKATALHAAAFAGRTEAAKQLIAYGISLDQQGPYNGYTALHDAIWQNHVDLAAVMIAAGADLSVRSQEGKTPLEMAKMMRHEEIAELLERQMTLTVSGE